MCDIDRYRTGVLLVQISAGLLASVFFAKTSVEGSEEDLPVAEAVDVPEAAITIDSVEDGATVVPVLDEGAGSSGLRRRLAGSVPLGRTCSNSDYRTIQMSAREVQSMRFDF